MIKNVLNLINNKFTKTLDTLTSKELNKLILFMDSPYFTTANSLTTKLFKLVMEYYPKFDNPDFNKETIYHSLYPEISFDAKKMRTLFSELTLLIEEFMVINTLKQKKFRFQQQKSFYYYEKGLFQAFNKEANKALVNWQEGNTIYGAYEKLSLYQHIHYYPYAEKQDLENTFLADANHLTDEVFVLNKLRYYSEVLSGKSIYNQHFELTFVAELMQIAEKLSHKNALIDLYLRLVYLMNDEKEEAYFLQTRDFFYQLFPSITPFEASIIITILLNYCGKQYNRKKVIFLTYQFQLFQYGLEEHLFELYGYLKHTTFMNILSTVFVLQEAVFLEKLFSIYMHKLKVAYRNNCKQIGMAYLCFLKNDYYNANQKVLFLTEKEIFFAIRARFLSLKCMFEFLIKDSSYKEPFLAKCNSFKAFINRQDDLSSKRKIAYLAHISILKKMALALNFERITVKKGSAIKQLIHNKEPLIGWLYLADKLHQLMSKGEQR